MRSLSTIGPFKNTGTRKSHRTEDFLVNTIFSFLIALCLNLGCASSVGPVRLKDTAEANYAAGIGAFKAKSYDKAIRYFEYLRSKFPFSKYATLAELRIADSYFQNNEFGSAADAYKLFMRFHPNHARSLDGYAAFQSARSQFKQIPGDFFVLPPSYEKDQKSVGVAAQELRSFVGTYPNSQYYPKGYKLLQKCLKRRIDHELYVANYYLKRRKTKSAILRYQNILKSFPEAEDRPLYVAELSRLYEKNGEHQKALALNSQYTATSPGIVSTSKGPAGEPITNQPQNNSESGSTANAISDSVPEHIPSSVLIPMNPTPKPSPPTPNSLPSQSTSTNTQPKIDTIDRGDDSNIGGEEEDNE